MNEYNPNHKYVPNYYVVGVKTIIVGPSGKILFLKRSDKTSRAHGWDFTGGAIEVDEDPIKAAIREAKEEAGLSIRDVKLLTTYSFKKKRGRNKYQVMMIGCYGYSDSEKVKISWEHEEYLWVTPKDASKLKLPAGLKKILDYLLDSRFKE